MELKNRIINYRINMASFEVKQSADEKQFKKN